MSTEKKSNNKKNNNIFSNYYLCTQSRYDKPILDQLLPFGSFTELDLEYGEKSYI